MAEHTQVETVETDPTPTTALPPSDLPHSPDGNNSCPSMPQPGNPNIYYYYYYLCGHLLPVVGRLGSSSVLLCLLEAGRHEHAQACSVLAMGGWPRQTWTGWAWTLWQEETRQWGLPELATIAQTAEKSNNPSNPRQARHGASPGDRRNTGQTGMAQVTPAPGDCPHPKPGLTMGQPRHSQKFGDQPHPSGGWGTGCLWQA